MVRKKIKEEGKQDNGTPQKKKERETFRMEKDPKDGFVYLLSPWPTDCMSRVVDFYRKS